MVIRRGIILTDVFPPSPFLFSDLHLPKSPSLFTVVTGHEEYSEPTTSPERAVPELQN